MGRGSAKRYAQAVFEIARDEGRFSEWLSNLMEMVAALEDTNLFPLLSNPKVSLLQKKEVLREAFRDIDPKALNLLYLLTSRNQVELLKEIKAECERLVDEYCGRERAEVITALPLSKRGQKEIIERLSGLREKEIRAEFRIDPDVLGGMVIKVGDKLIDGSVKEKLIRLRKEIVEVG
jgi:F-type H+-transporting ATPase subunit delta